MYLNGSDGSVDNLDGNASHEKCIPQLNPPRTIGDALYENVLGLIMSIMGQTTLWGSS